MTETTHEPTSAPVPTTPTIPGPPSLGPAQQTPGMIHIAVRRTHAGAVRLARRLRGIVRRDDGMTTAEYAVGTVAAVAFSGVLYKVVTSDAVSSGLQAILDKALNAGF